MTELDQALEIFQQHMQDPQKQSQFYDLFLNSSFYVPTLDSEAAADGMEPEAGEKAVPLILEAEGDDYLLLFDTEERLREWAQAEVRFVLVPGHVLAVNSTPPLHWALNVGCERSKAFLPEEIAWLKEVVERCEAGAQPQEEG